MVHPEEPGPRAAFEQYKEMYCRLDVPLSSKADMHPGLLRVQVPYAVCLFMWVPQHMRDASVIMVTSGEGVRKGTPTHTCSVH